jgi:2-polyprenyl-3-methyl-5-hydroxy-6-metoxy-1,4-benzoquinol methylase
MFRVGGHAIERCASCAFVQVRDQPDPEILRKIYDELHIKHLTYRDEAAAIHENRRRVALMRRFVQDGADVLDAGCATGGFLVQARMHVRASGFDVSSRAIEVARQRCPDIADRLWEGSVDDLHERPETYDAICLWDVIEHLWDPIETLRLLFSRLRPGGVLLLSTPDSGAPIARLFGRRWAFMIPPEHLSLFAHATFRYVFQSLQPGEIVHHVSQGKRTNLAFVLYKLERMAGRAFPRGLMRRAADSAWGRVLVYIPTGDIQYLVVRKPADPAAAS